jgi:hypothetical protein
MSADADLPCLADSLNYVVGRLGWYLVFFYQSFPEPYRSFVLPTS